MIYEIKKEGFRPRLISLMLITGFLFMALITFKIVILENKIKRIPYEAASRLEIKVKKKPRIANRQYRRARGIKFAS